MALTRTQRSVVIAAFTCLATPAAGQGTASRQGELVERIVSAADSSQAYALFLPAAYTEERRWPLLLVLDPRGRALLPLQRLRAVANERGYVIMSSYNSLSDGPIEPNVSAMNAMIADALRSLAIDRRRLYIVGFSGTARLAWGFTQDLREHVAGLVGVGAGIGRSAFGYDSSWRRLVFYGASGWHDFNYDEMRLMEALLDTLGVTHRVTYFAGRHEWPPESVFQTAVEWLDLQAMRRGLLARDSAWVEQFARRQLAAARELDATGSSADALDAYRAIVEDFGDLAAAVEASERMTALAARADVQRAVARRAELLHASARYRAVVDLAIGALNARTRRPSARDLARLLAVDSLRREAARGPSEAADAAQRLLEFAFVITSFYQPRYYLERNDWERALTMLDVAALIDAGHPRLCVQRALARAIGGHVKETVRELECARQAGALTAALLADRAFDRIRSSAEFRSLVATVSGH
jgi:predicted esterase